jgi:integrase
MQYNVTYRKKDKGWQYIISIKKDGRWKYAGSKQGFRTKPLAKLAADERVEEMKKKNEIKLTEGHDKITLGQFKEMFLSDLEPYREDNTITNYKVAFAKFNALDNMIMENIEFAHVQNCINQMMKEDLEPSTIKLYVSKLKILFKSAIKPYKIITENPIANDIILPKIKKDKKVKALTRSELDYLLANIRPERDYIVCLLASHCGMRIGEVVGLCEYDIDFKKREVDINKQWKKLKNGEYGFGTVKSQNRIIPIPNTAIEPLKKYLNSNVKNLDRKILPDKNTNATTARISYKMGKLGLDNSAHDLRHTYATTLIANGIDFQTVAQFMGDTVETVIKAYSHFTEDMAIAGAKKVNQIF